MQLTDLLPLVVTPLLCKLYFHKRRWRPHQILVHVADLVLDTGAHNIRSSTAHRP